MTLRYFPADDKKYCYTFEVISRTRYLVRATFLYGNFYNNNVYPKFDISLGATHWATIVISDANTIELQELIFLALDPTISVCLSNATTGQPFISTLELRQFNGSIYLTQYESQFYLSISARINFGADSEAPVRYPDDPFDRIWESDSLRKANYLVDVAAGTEKVSTKMPIDVSSGERPPQKVMQSRREGKMKKDERDFMDVLLSCFPEDGDRLVFGHKSQDIIKGTALAAASEALNGKQLKDLFNTTVLHETITQILDVFMSMGSPHHWMDYLMPEGARSYKLVAFSNNGNPDLSDGTTFDQLMVETHAVLSNAHCLNLQFLIFGN